MKPTILILHASGTNRDTEAARACELAGGVPEIVHINQMRRGERRFSDYEMLLIPGGFSYGDALGAGGRLALDLQVYFDEQLHSFVESGKPVLGICNGFQTLVKAGLLPGENLLESTPKAGTRRNLQSAIPARSATLTHNASGHFECRWVHLQTNRNAKATCLQRIDELIFCPIAHGEGNFQVCDETTLVQIEQNHQIAFRYVDQDGNAVAGRYPLNPNGSVADIAGICNARGNVVGLMPHPEDHILPIQNPLGRKDRLGLALFQAMIGAM